MQPDEHSPGCIRVFRQPSNNTSTESPDDWEVFTRQLTANFEALFNALVQVYGDQYDFYYHLETLLVTLAESWQNRPVELKELDRPARMIRSGFNPTSRSAVFAMWTCSPATWIDYHPEDRLFQRTRPDLPASHAAVPQPSR